MELNLAEQVQQRLTSIDSFLAEQREVIKKQNETITGAEAKVRRFIEDHAGLLLNTSGDPEAPVHRMPLGLRQNKQLAEWMRQPKSRNSSVAFDIAGRGLITKNTVTSVAPSRVTAGVVGPPAAPVRLLEVIPTVNISVGSVIYVEELSNTNAAAVVPETTLKPESAITFGEKTLTTETVAHWLKMSLQAASDSPDILNWVEQRLAQGVLTKGEDLALNTAVSGLLAKASALAAGFKPSVGAPGLDVIAGCISQLLSKGFQPDAIVLNPVDLLKMRLVKAAPGGEYLWGDPESSLPAATCWSVPVIVSPYIAADTVLVGQFSAATLNYVREVVRVDVAYENQDDFVKNLCTVRAEQRSVVATLLPSGLVKSPLTITAE